MKRRSLLLSASLTANVALVAWLASVRSGLGPNFLPAVITSAVASDPRTTTAAPPLTPAQSAVLRSADLDRMKAAGVPEDVANILAAGRAFSKLQALRIAREKTRVAHPAYWQTNHGPSEQNQADQAAEDHADQEFEAAMHRAFPEFAEAENGIDARAYLPASARAKLDRIERDYHELEEEINSRSEAGLSLPTDFAKLKLLADEKRRDIAAALSPAELEALELHESPTAGMVRSRYGDAVQSEADYLKIFALRKAFDDRFLHSMVDDVEVSAEEIAARRVASRQLQADIRGVIGEENFARFQRTQDPSYAQLGIIAKRLNLPASTPDAVYAIRDQYAAQSEALYNDPTLSAAERTANIKTLETLARAELKTRLGPEGTEAYAPKANWLSLLKNGAAFSTNPKDGSEDVNPGNTVYPLYGSRPSLP